MANLHSRSEGNTPAFSCNRNAVSAKMGLGYAIYGLSVIRHLGRRGLLSILSAYISDGQLERLFSEAGFKVKLVFGDYEYQKLGADTVRLIMLSRAN
jgi:hypothetical protein